MSKDSSPRERRVHAFSLPQIFGGTLKKEFHSEAAFQAKGPSHTSLWQRHRLIRQNTIASAEGAAQIQKRTRGNYLTKEWQSVQNLCFPLFPLRLRVQFLRHEAAFAVPDSRAAAVLTFSR